MGKKCGQSRLTQYFAFIPQHLITIQIFNKKIYLFKKKKDGNILMKILKILIYDLVKLIQNLTSYSLEAYKVLLYR